MDIKEVTREAVAIAMIVAAIVVLISLITYSPQDDRNVHYTGNTQPAEYQNKCGFLGAVLSGFLFRSIGIAGYVLVFFISMWGAVLAFSKKQYPYFWYRFLASLFLVFAVSLFLSLNSFSSWTWPPNEEAIYPLFRNYVRYSLNLGDVGLGGEFGCVAAQAAVMIIGKVGAEIISVGLILITLEFSFGFLFSTLIIKTCRWSRDKIHELRDRKALMNKIKRDKPSPESDIEIQGPADKPEKEKPAPAKPSEAPTPAAPPKSAGLEKPEKGKGAGSMIKDLFTPSKKEKKPKPEPEKRPKKKPEEKKPVQAPKGGEYTLPPVNILEEIRKITRDGTQIHQKRAQIIEEVLGNFKIKGTVVSINPGPVITQYEVELGAGVRVNAVLQLSDNLSMALQSPGIRIEAPIPGQAAVGIEVPNKESETVKLKDLLDTMPEKVRKAQIPLVLGKDTMGKPIGGDLATMPHLLIAGATGSGKTVCINSILISILMLRKPDEVKLVIIDPKMVDMAAYKGIPHLLTPVVTDTQKAENVLNWAVTEMERRYKLFSITGARDLKTYNKLTKEGILNRLEEAGNPPIYRERGNDVPYPMPFLVIVVDELADLMFASPKEIEGSITRIAQKARAAGIHLILSTQRPSVDVITGLIKSNIPSRIAFQVAAKVDSRTILDMNGAEDLLGKGDMLYLPPGTSKMIRAQGVFVSDDEIRDVVEFCKVQAEPIFTPAVDRTQVMGAGSDIGEIDESLEDAIRVTVQTQRGSASLLQRKLGVGYNRATKLIETMEALGAVGPYIGSKAREVLMTEEEFDEIGLQGLLDRYEQQSGESNQ